MTMTSFTYSDLLTEILKTVYSICIGIINFDIFGCLCFYNSVLLVAGPYCECSWSRPWDDIVDSMK